MRDLARIERIMNVLSRIWRQNPDLRIGQILVSVAQVYGFTSPDIFHVEDDDILQALLDYEKQFPSKGQQ